MPNGSFESLSIEVQDKLAHGGVDGISEKELLVLVAYKVDKLNERVGYATNLIRQPFWRHWTLKEIMSAIALIFFLLGAINWQTLSQILKGV